MPSSGVQTCRSEEHTSELQSHSHLVCRLLLEKKKNTHGRALPSQLAARSHRIASNCSRALRYCVPTVAPRTPCSSRPATPALFFFFLKDRAPPEFTLFPHTTLFR